MRKLRLSEPEPTDCPWCGLPAAEHPPTRPGQPNWLACILLMQSQVETAQAAAASLERTTWDTMTTLRDMLTEAYQHNEVLRQSATEGAVLYRRLADGRDLNAQQKRLILTHEAVLSFCDRVWQDGRVHGLREGRKRQLLEAREEKGEPTCCTCDTMTHPPCSFCESLSEEEADLFYSSKVEGYDSAATDWEDDCN